MKHIDMKYHYLKEQVGDKVIDIVYVPTELQIADIFTKPLPKEQYERLRSLMGVIPH